MHRPMQRFTSYLKALDALVDADSPDPDSDLVGARDSMRQTIANIEQARSRISNRKVVQEIMANTRDWYRLSLYIQRPLGTGLE